MIKGDGDGEEGGEILVLYSKGYKEEKAPDRQKQVDKRRRASGKVHEMFGTRYFVPYVFAYELQALQS